MTRLLESDAKAWLATAGLPVPRGRATADVGEVALIAGGLGGAVMVKALVPTGRRGKAGAVRSAATPGAAAEAARALLGTMVEGHPVAAVYVEERVAIARELFLSFSLTDDGPQVLASRDGGVEIEGRFAARPGAIRRAPIDPLCGLSGWRAMELWHDCGVTGAVLRPLGTLTALLYDAFRRADATLLEINPLAIDVGGHACLVGTMMAIDVNAAFRQAQWPGAVVGTAAPRANEREERVRRASAELPGGSAQYVELAGDIGLLVGGGGAGLYVHDLIVAMGGCPANHCVTPPTGSDISKLKEVVRAILANPRVHSLLVAFNFAQMARVDLRMQALAEVLREREIDTRRFPVVLRLFGFGEDVARRTAAAFPGLTYLPRGASLRDAAAEIVRRTRSPGDGVHQ